MHTSKPVIVILFTLTLPFLALAQQVNLTGRLIDEQNRPLHNGTVLIGDLWADTDSNGDFLLVGDAPREIEFTMAKIGYLPITEPLTITTGNLGNFILKKRPGPAIPAGKGKLENSDGQPPFVFTVTGKVSMGKMEYKRL